MKKKTPSFGLVLEGGGAKGAFHMGAVKALKEQGYEIGAVAGTSIGALNGAVIAQGDFELGYKWWQRMDTGMLFNIEKAHIEDYLNKQVSYNTIKGWLAIARDIISSRGLDTSKIREVLGEVIDEEKIRKSKIDFGLVTISLSDLKPLELFKEDIPEGFMLDYLMASANFPAFKLKPIEGKYYLDGGFYDNCPYNLLGRKGYKDIIAIRTMSLGRIRRIDKDINVLTILPSKELGKILFFDNNTIQENLKMGYCDAMRVLKRLRGSSYYIDSDLNDGDIVLQLTKLSRQDITQIKESMGIMEESSLRLLLEKILPELASLTGLPYNSEYQDIIIAVLERAADAVSIEKYEVYSPAKFIKAIKKKLEDVDVLKPEPAPMFAVRKQRRNAVITKAAEIFLEYIKF